MVVLEESQGITRVIHIHHHHLGNMNVCTEFCANPRHRCSHISNEIFLLLLILQEKSQDHLNYQDSSSEDPEFLCQISKQSTKRSSRHRTQNCQHQSHGDPRRKVRKSLHPLGTTYAHMQKTHTHIQAAYSFKPTA